VVVVLGLVVLLGILGLAIDMGYLRYMKRKMQTAADAAAIAAAGEIDFGDFNTAGLKASSNNGFTNGTANVTVTINHPPSVGDPHAGNNFYAEAIVSQPQNTYFARIFGVNSVPLTVRAVAAEGGGNNCIFALTPNNTGLAVVALAVVSSPCGIVVESSSNNAITCALLAAINASSIGVVGNVGSFLCTITPTPKKIKVPVPADPLAAWAAANAPAVGTCGTTPSSPYTGASAPLNLTGSVVLLPGVYCGGIQLLPGANATFLAGTYILKSTNNAGVTIANSQGLKVDVAASAHVVAFNGSNGVTFYNPGPAGAIQFIGGGAFSASGVKFTAPTSGAYEGMLFFQPSTNTNAAQIVGTPTFFTTLQGSYYFPGAAVNFAFSGPVAYNILVAKSINFFIFTFANGTQASASTIQQDYSSLSNGSPIKGGYGVLVE
jgi:Flp pilus assembly protein TadG